MILENKWRKKMIEKSELTDNLMDEGRGVKNCYMEIGIWKNKCVIYTWTSEALEKMRIAQEKNKN